MCVRLPYLLVVNLLLGICMLACTDLTKLDADDEATAKRRSQSRQQDTLLLLRDIAFARGIDQFTILAGVANAETGLTHCWSDATWACQGPNSDSCNGGPVIAGAGDGPCWKQQGGLGLFQLDGGTFDQTIAREGWKVLDLAGNIELGLSFIITMIQQAKGFRSEQSAIDWLNGINIGSARYNEWIDIVVERYNGCIYGRCSIFLDRWYHYDGKTRAMASAIDRLPPISSRTWIGSECETDQECAFRTENGAGQCLKGNGKGVCVVDCEGYCPDRAGFAPTFCAAAKQVNSSEGGFCMAKSHHTNQFCSLSSHQNVLSVDRFIGASTAQDKVTEVCTPKSLNHLNQEDEEEVSDHSDSTDSSLNSDGNTVCEDRSLPLSQERCSTTQEETWRCACHESYAVKVSQVCRSGMWVNYQLNPDRCEY